MNVEVMLAAVLGSVFLIDFILKSIKKNSQYDITEKTDETDSPRRYRVLISNATNYIRKRKKNFVLSMIITTALKIGIHYFLYTSWHNKYVPFKKMTDDQRDLWRKNPQLEWFNIDEPFLYHVETVFIDKIHLFIPAILTVAFISWFFSDRITAR
ncbi:MAG: hypothetical protein HN625_06820 [Flavobacteriaceae bacterium]|jgi:hypothetical protein|nr:hypothetical protein [Flavobacteriaceae bacterium]